MNFIPAPPPPSFRVELYNDNYMIFILYYIYITYEEKRKVEKINNIKYLFFFK